MWIRSEDSVRAFNSTRVNASYFPELQLNERVHAYSTFDRFFEDGLNVLLWALPSEICREQARLVAPWIKGDEVVLHATKGIEPESLKRVSEVLAEELPTRRIGVISGPNLAYEIAKGQPTATVIASAFAEVCEAGESLLSNEGFRTFPMTDVIGVEWAGALKNILAIAAGALDALQFGWNTRAFFITQGLNEMIRFSVAMGAKESTFFGLAGMGDLLATCSSPMSRNYRVGSQLAQGHSLATVLADLGVTAEGVRTTLSVWEYAVKQKIPMPITERVYRILKEEVSAKEALLSLMS